MGARMLAEWLANPLADRAAIDAGWMPWPNWSPTPRLCDDLRERLRGIYDLERLLARVTTGRATPRDLALSAARWPRCRRSRPGSPPAAARC